MKIRKLSKMAVITMTAGVLIVGAIAAYAYFTSPGSGSGSASVGTSSTIELSSDPVATLYPGGPALPITVSIHNPGEGNQYVATISGTVADNGGCLGSWFTVESISYDTNVLAGATTTAATTVSMDESGTNQDACKSLTMTIDWISN